MMNNFTLVIPATWAYKTAHFGNYEYLIISEPSKGSVTVDWTGRCYRLGENTNTYPKSIAFTGRGWKDKLSAAAVGALWKALNGDKPFKPA